MSSSHFQNLTHAMRQTGHRYYLRRKRTTFNHLPDDIIIEILCKFPMKTVLGYTIVCKNWYSLIKSPALIQTHFLKHKDDINNNGIISRLPSYLCGGYRYSLHFHNRDFNNYRRLHLPLDCGGCRSFSVTRVTGSCNGLLLVTHTHCMSEVDFCFLWNPTIGKLLFPPRPISLFYGLMLCFKKGKMMVKTTGFHTNCYFGLGFDSATFDYKILAVVRSWKKFDRHGERFSVRFQLYSVNANSWKIINSVPSDYGGVDFVCYEERAPPVFAFVNGFLHIVGFRRIRSNKNINAGGDSSRTDEYRNFIVAFDVGKETFGEILLPESLAHVDPYWCSVWAYRDSSIAVAKCDLVTKQFSLWVMGKYGVEDSWTKLVITDALLIRSVCNLVAFRNNGELVVSTYAGAIFLYDLEEQKFKYRCEYLEGYPAHLYPYVRSLALLDVGRNEGDENWCG